MGCTRMVRSEAGATAVIVAVSLTMLLGFVALAIDLAHLYSVRNELKNTADAAALAAAKSLYNHDNSGTVNTGANTVARDAVNAMRNTGLTIDDPTPWTNLGANTGDIQRGHWSHSANRFYRTDATSLPTDFFTSTAAHLDDPATHDFVNAVMVRTRRQTNPITMTFARLFGIDDIATRRASIAWLGYASSFAPWTIDAPIAICSASILDFATNTMTCTVGKMIPSTTDTSKWTNFTQDDSPYNGENNCGESFGNSGLVDLIDKNAACDAAGINPDAIRGGYGVSTKEGQMEAMEDLRVKWRSRCVDHDNNPATPLVNIDTNDPDTKPDYPWKMTLLVIDCTNPLCNKVVGAVSIEVLWISDRGSDPHYAKIPEKMWDETSTPPAFWECHGTTDAERVACLNSFFQRFNIHNASGALAREDLSSGSGTRHDYVQTTLYFRPDCSAKEPTGTTGGDKFGILSDIPVLVDHMRIDAHADVVLENQ